MLTPTPGEASAEVAEALVRDPDTVYVASAVGDAVTGSSVAGIMEMPLLLVGRDEVPQAVHEQLRRLRPAHIVVLGGPASVTPSVRQQLADYLRPDEDSEVESLDAML